MNAAKDDLTNNGEKKLGERLATGRRSRWWRRRGRTRRTFWYETHDGQRISDDAHLDRIRALAIPPAWTDVLVSPLAGSRVQAIGIDARGRVQRIYHVSFAASRQRRKYSKIERFGERLPALRRATNEHLAHEGLTRERVLAVVVRLINDLYFRIGSEESVRRYRTYGVTTLRNRHLEIKRGGRLVFNFVGKHHIRHRRILVDEELATLIADIKSLGGAKLFEYIDDEGRVRAITPRDVNEYIKAHLGEEFSAKDFRTWGGTLRGAIELAELGKAETERDAKTKIAKAVKRVAEHLGNTPTVCRDCYIHPTVIEKYMKGVTLDEFRPRKERRVRRREQPDYEKEEAALLKLLSALKNGAGGD